MASPCKKSKTEHEESNTSDLKGKKESNGIDANLNSFISWCDSKKFNLNKKVTVSREGSCAQYGMIALQDVEKEEVLFEIARPVLLHPHTSAIADIMKNGEDQLMGDSGWVPLLVTLMFEYTNPTSEWRPYLDLCPDFDELDQPMFWSREEVELELQGTGIPEAVFRDEENICREYETIALPFIKKHLEKFDPKVHTLDLYKKMVAFVMAYSFTEPAPLEDEDEEEDEPAPPMMVAMADILNHVAKNNAKLRFGKDSLKMVAAKKIAKGEEVYNTYGELANWQLLHMYGFAEPYPDNIYDTVDIPMSVFYKCASDIDDCDKELLQNKWQMLKDRGVVTDDGAFIVGVEGVLTETELEIALKVVFMTETEFEENKESDGWSSDEEGDNQVSFTNDGVSQLNPAWRSLLIDCIKESLTRYKDSISADEAKMTPEVLKTLTNRQKFSLYVRIGQKKLLHQFQDLCTFKLTSKGAGR